MAGSQNLTGGQFPVGLLLVRAYCVVLMRLLSTLVDGILRRRVGVAGMLVSSLPELRSLCMIALSVRLSGGTVRMRCRIVVVSGFMMCFFRHEIFLL